MTIWTKFALWYAMTSIGYLVVLAVQMGLAIRDDFRTIEDEERRDPDSDATPDYDAFRGFYREHPALAAGIAVVVLAALAFTWPRAVVRFVKRMLRKKESSR